MTPTLQWREADHIYWHGSSASRMLETCIDADVCVTVTMIDAMVMARSAFNHSCNYRSVMVMGKAHHQGCGRKGARLKNFTDKLFPGRWDILRPVTPKELKATMMLGLSLEEASAKVRNGPRAMTRKIMPANLGGLIPMRTEILAATADARNLLRLAPPEHVTNLKMG